ncbi:hypothetical protein DRN51_06565 [Thermococci archaeon]|nr:MAG: hypothetical protein DRN51_06565 [Thermococci archaeon]
MGAVAADPGLWIQNHILGLTALVDVVDYADVAGVLEDLENKVIIARIPSMKDFTRELIL